MHKHSFCVQTPENAGRIYNALMETASSGSYDSLTVAIAYATRMGCERLVKGLASTVHSWGKMQKRWLISIDGGITDPDALEYLAQLPNSVVRIPDAETCLKNLKLPYRFHSKLYLFECSSNREKVALFCGSCNLTQSGLYFNAEQATSFVLAPPISRQERSLLVNVRKQKRIIETVFQSSTALNKTLLEKYRSQWQPANLPKIERKDHTKAVEAKPVIPSPKAITLATADAFWVKVTNKVVQNLGKGKPGNQVDLQRGSRTFFGFGVGEVALNTVLGSVPIRFEGMMSPFSMRYGDNYMDKINLPVLQSPRTYAKKTLLFRRRKDGAFRLKIGSLNQEKAWRKLSEEQGTLYQMQSGRPYGVFSRLPKS